MVYAERDGDRIVLQTLYQHRDDVKRVPGATWDRRTERWSTRLSWAACLALRGVFGAQLQIGPELTAWATAEARDRVQPCMALHAARSLDGLPSFEPGSRAFRALEALAPIEADLESRGLALYPFQRTGAVLLAAAGGAMLQDEPGAGKSCQAVVGMRIWHAMEGALPALVLCPGTMRHTWKREIETWWPGCRAAVVSGSALKRRKVLEDPASWDVAVLNWEAARLHSRLAPYGSVALTAAEREPKELNAIRFRTVVTDEAHALRNASKQTRAAWAVGHQDGVTLRIGLTGTPIADTPADEWGLLHFLDPNEHPGRTRYVDRYVQTSYDWAGYLVLGGLKEETKDEFFRVTDPRTRRVTKAEALPHLPPMVFEERVVEMGDRQARAYRAMRDDKMTSLDGALLTGMNGLSVLTRLTQLASSYAEVSYDEARCRHGEVPGQECVPCGGVALPAEIVTLTEPSCKLDALEELLDELGPTEPLVVAAASRQLIDLAEARLDRMDPPVSHVSVKGGQTADVRQASVDAFQRGDARVILLTIAAGGVGITLTRSKTLAFIQKSWDAIQVEQTVHRVHREGSQVHDSVRIVSFVSEGTVEEGQREALTGKGERLQEVVRDEEALAAFVLRGGTVKPKKSSSKKQCRHKWAVQTADPPPGETGEACEKCGKPRPLRKSKKPTEETE